MEREWRKGFPKHTQGLEGYNLFEILLSKTLLENETVAEAYVRDGKWHLQKNGLEVDSDLITGWRETYDCLTAKRAIDEYVRKEIIISKKPEEKTKCKRWKSY